MWQAGLSGGPFPVAVDAGEAGGGPVYMGPAVSACPNAVATRKAKKK